MQGSAIKYFHSYVLKPSEEVKISFIDINKFIKKVVEFWNLDTEQIPRSTASFSQEAIEISSSAYYLLGKHHIPSLPQPASCTWS